MDDKAGSVVGRLFDLSPVPGLVGDTGSIGQERIDSDGIRSIRDACKRGDMERVELLSGQRVLVERMVDFVKKLDECAAAGKGGRVVELNGGGYLAHCA